MVSFLSNLPPPPPPPKKNFNAKNNKKENKSEWLARQSQIPGASNCMQVETMGPISSPHHKILIAPFQTKNGQNLRKKQKKK
jgi:hypothetical protein